MSYILDALKKAEAEQDPQARVSLAMDARDRQRQRLIQYLVVAALLVNAAVLAYLFAPQILERLPMSASEAATDTPASPDAVATAAAPAAAATGGSGLLTNRADGSNPAPATRSEVPTAVVTRSEPEPEPAPKPMPKPAPKRVTLSELPAAARSRFPGLSFSTHLYSSDADLRAVVVNGQRLQEGDQLGVLTLASITEDGVVFRFENYLVTISVLDDWN